MKGQGYTTASRTKILEYLKAHQETTVAAKDIHQYLIEENSEANVTTIYRYLDKLVKDGIVNKYVSDKVKKAVFQYAGQGEKCHQHLHLQCLECGKIIHMDCAFMGEISRHIQDEHHFQLSCEKSILYGRCRECQKH